MNRFDSAPLVLLASLAVLSACGGNESSGSGAQSREAPGASSAADPSEAPSEPARGARVADARPRERVQHAVENLTDHVARQRLEVGVGGFGARGIARHVQEHSAYRATRDGASMAASPPVG